MEESYHLGIKALLRNSAGEILLLKVNPAALGGAQRDYWDLPGGRVQKGQGVLETLRREVEEETGITAISSPKPLGMVLANIRIPLKSGESVGLILSVYACDIADGTAITISDEHIVYRWFTPREAAELLQVKYPADFCDLISAL